MKDCALGLLAFLGLLFLWPAAASAQCKNGQCGIPTASAATIILDGKTYMRGTDGVYRQPTLAIPGCACDDCQCGEECRCPIRTPVQRIYPESFRSGGKFFVKHTDGVYYETGPGIPRPTGTAPLNARRPRSGAPPRTG